MEFYAAGQAGVVEVHVYSVEAGLGVCAEADESDFQIRTFPGIPEEVFAPRRW